MRRVLVSWRGVRIWSHPACVYTGLVLGVFAQQWAARAAGLETWRAYVAVLALIPAALAGNRLLWLVTDKTRVRRRPFRAGWRSGGGVMYGGLPVVLLVSIPLLAALGLPYRRFWDVMTFCILPAMAIGRVGCLLNGCCHGRPSTSRFAMRLPDAHGRWCSRHPTQLLEAGLAALLLLGAVVIGPARLAPGVLFLLIVAGYAASRLALQPLRDCVVRIGGRDLASVVSLTLLVSAVVGLVLAG